MFSTRCKPTRADARAAATINWYLDQRDEASFPFLAGEALFLAAKAEWVATGKGKDDPDGILYLTDQRLVFEQKETTGKKAGFVRRQEDAGTGMGNPAASDRRREAGKQRLSGRQGYAQFHARFGRALRAITVEVKGGVPVEILGGADRAHDQGRDDRRAGDPAGCRNAGSDP